MDCLNLLIGKKLKKNSSDLDFGGFFFTQHCHQFLCGHRLKCFFDWNFTFITATCLIVSSTDIDNRTTRFGELQFETKKKMKKKQIFKAIQSNSLHRHGFLQAETLACMADDVVYIGKILVPLYPTRELCRTISKNRE